ncbi:MAG TPA: ATP-dependent DNA ligase [Terriglobales bacterium]|nr:ATP-dependent DNA ligase [Terriglobales bacterium]
MHLFSATCEAIAGTGKKTEKVRILADYLRRRTLDEAAVSAVFFSGRPFPAWEETTLQVGGSLLWQVLRELTGKPDVALTAAYRRHGDLGSAAYDLLVAVAPAASTLNVIAVEARFRDIAQARGPAAKAKLTAELLARATALEAKYLIKIVTGELRIGLKESLVEEAIAKAFEEPHAAVQRADMLLGDIGETLRLAAAHRLSEARMRLFHPLGFMLASPVETAEEGFAYFQLAQVEDKYDGIRAQAHCDGKRVRLFSRTLDDITESFPELPEPLANFAEPVILDGEVLAWSGERALPFSELQKRLGRKKVSPALMRSVPVAYVVFDVLYAGGELVIDRPLRERGAILDRVFSEAHSLRTTRLRDPQGKLVFEAEIGTAEPDGALGQVIRAPRLVAESPAELDALFAAAQARGNEGLMIKDVESPYAPGRRGRSWLKLKRELATLDVVVTAVEYGHGKRAGVLSDYTFAVRNGEELVNVGKAYSGLTDAEIAELTDWFLRHTVVDQGFRREVEPTIIVEVAFNAVMRSDRHNSGYALRFPRIVRLRWDKRVGDIDTLARVKEIYQQQKTAYPSAG